MQFRRLIPLLAVGFVATAFVACDNDLERSGDLGPVEPADPIPVTDYVTGVAMSGTAGGYSPETIPTGEADAPLLSGSNWFIRGGQIALSVTVDESATELYVSTSNADIGYFTVPLDAQAIEIGEMRAQARIEKLAAIGRVDDAPEVSAFRAPVTVTLTLTPAENASSFRAVVRSFDGETVSAQMWRQYTLNNNAESSAELQASLNWVDPVDYDLHLQTPNGETIYWASTTGQNGGELDLDSNMACSLDYVQNENITWTTNSPAAGTYNLFVHLWSACADPGPFPYLVTLVIDGQAQTFEGSLTVEDAGVYPEGHAQAGTPQIQLISSFTID